jgi:hypothetical protein
MLVSRWISLCVTPYFLEKHTSYWETLHDACDCWNSVRCCPSRTHSNVHRLDWRVTKVTIFWNVAPCSLMVTNISEETSAFIFKVQQWAAQENDPVRRHRIPLARCQPPFRSVYSCTLKMEAAGSFFTSVWFYRRHMLSMRTLCFSDSRTSLYRTCVWCFIFVLHGTLVKLCIQQKVSLCCADRREQIPVTFQLRNRPTSSRTRCHV